MLDGAMAHLGFGAPHWRSNMHRFKNIEQVGLPPSSRLASTYGQADFADAFSVDLSEAGTHDVESLARHVGAALRPQESGRSPDAGGRPNQHLSCVRTIRARDRLRGRRPASRFPSVGPCAAGCTRPPSPAHPHHARLLQSPARPRLYRADRADSSNGRTRFAAPRAGGRVACRGSR